MGVSLERSALALLCLVVLAGMAGVAVGSTATQPAPPTPGDANEATANVTVLDWVPLVTGDGVVDELDAWWLFDEYVAGISIAGD